MASVVQYDFGADSWSSAGALTQPRQALGAAVLGQQLYVLLGQASTGGAVLGSVERYNALADSWALVGNASLFPRAFFAALAV